MGFDQLEDLERVGEGDARELGRDRADVQHVAGAEREGGKRRSFAVRGCTFAYGLPTATVSGVKGVGVG